MTMLFFKIQKGELSLTPGKWRSFLFDKKILTKNDFVFFLMQCVHFNAMSGL